MLMIMPIGPVLVCVAPGLLLCYHFPSLLGSIPHLSIRFADGFVWTSNNELGFSSDNVLAVCSINKSTKKGTAAIGRKGIGFKSVFKGTFTPNASGIFFLTSQFTL